MERFIIFSLGLIFVFLAGCAKLPKTPEELALAKQQCESKEDYGVFTYIYAYPECIQTRIKKRGSSAFVCIHGADGNIISGYSLSPMRNSEWFNFCDDIAESTGKTSMVIALPGVDDSSQNVYGIGPKSYYTNDPALGSGKFYGMLVTLLKTFKKEYQIDDLNLFGLSMGGKMAALISSKYRKNLDISHVITYGGTLMFGQMLFDNNYGDYLAFWPSYYVNSIPADKSMSFLIIGGENDNEVLPKYSIGYHEKLIDRGIPSTCLILKNGIHSFYKHWGNRPAVTEAITDFLQGKEITNPFMIKCEGWTNNN